MATQATATATAKHVHTAPALLILAAGQVTQHSNVPQTGMLATVTAAICADVRPLTPEWKVLELARALWGVEVGGAAADAAVYLLAAALLPSHMAAPGHTTRPAALRAATVPHLLRSVYAEVHALVMELHKTRDIKDAYVICDQLAEYVFSC